MQISILNKIYQVEVSDKKFLKERVVLSDTKITIFLSEDNAKHPKTIFEKWLREYARKIITDRTKTIATQNDFKFNKISIREQSTRWGSCSSDKNLNFNWKLILAPLEVLDYVVTHELAHTVQMNHSHAFWKVVEGAMPSYLEYRKSRTISTVFVHGYLKSWCW